MRDRSKGWLALCSVALVGVFSWHVGSRYFHATSIEDESAGANVASGMRQVGRAGNAAESASNAGASSGAAGRAADASPGDVCEKSYQRLLARHFAQLEKTPDTRGQLAFALLASTEPAMLDPRHPRHGTIKRRIETTYQALARQVPEDPLSAWVHATRCQEGEACDAAFGRLSRLEPDNAAVWLLGFQRAWRDEDFSTADAHLARAASAKYYDAHWGDAPLFLRDVLPADPMPECVAAFAPDDSKDSPAGTYPDTFGLMAATMVSMVWDIPALSIEPCSRNGLRPGDGAQRDRCRAVYKLVADSDTMVARSIGTVRMVELTAGTTDQVYWRERVREFAWATEVGYRLREDERFADRWERGEWAMLVARMERARKWPVPGGWLPSVPYRRELVLTGRVSQG